MKKIILTIIIFFTFSNFVSAEILDPNISSENLPKSVLTEEEIEDLTNILEKEQNPQEIFNTTKTTNVLGFTAETKEAQDRRNKIVGLIVIFFGLSLFITLMSRHKRK